jgi:hypothetical protein
MAPESWKSPNCTLRLQLPLPYDDSAKLTARGVGHGSVPAGGAYCGNVPPITYLLAFLRPSHKTCPGTTT